MKRAAVFFVEGFEEVEALTVVDILRRGDVQTDMIAIGSNLLVTGRTDIGVRCDKTWDEADLAAYDALILPGGMPGSRYLGEHKGLTAALKEAAAKGKIVAAICAAPTVLGGLGLLEGKPACCYPGMEEGLLGADKREEPVCVADNIVTSRGIGTAIPFALTLLLKLEGEAKAKEIKTSIVYDWQKDWRP